jgi:hypothetical protein
VADERRAWAQLDADAEYYDRVFYQPQYHYPTMFEDSMSLIPGRSFAGNMYLWPIRYFPPLRPGCDEQDMAIAIAKAKRRNLYVRNYENQEQFPDTALAFKLFDNALSPGEL